MINYKRFIFELNIHSRFFLHIEMPINSNYFNCVVCILFVYKWLKNELSITNILSYVNILKCVGKDS